MDALDNVADDLISQDGGLDSSAEVLNNWVGAWVQVDDVASCLPQNYFPFAFQPKLKQMYQGVINC